MSLLDKIKKAEKSQSFWNPKEGEAIAGRVVDIRELNGQYGPSKILDVESEETGELVAIRCATVIEREISRKNVKIGDSIGIKFLGKKNNYYDYVVIVEHAPTDSDEETPF